MPVKILLADDHAMFRELIQNVLCTKVKDYVVVAEADTGPRVRLLVIFFMVTHFLLLTRNGHNISPDTIFYPSGYITGGIYRYAAFFPEREEENWLLFGERKKRADKVKDEKSLPKAGT